MSKKKFHVPIKKISYMEESTYEVIADSPEEAEELALQLAKDNLFQSEAEAKYDVTDPIELQPIPEVGIPINDYIAKERCPICYRQDIEGESFDCDEEGVTQVMHCLGCEATWTATYVRSGYINLKGSEDNECLPKPGPKEQTFPHGDILIALGILFHTYLSLSEDRDVSKSWGHGVVEVYDYLTDAAVALGEEVDRRAEDLVGVPSYDLVDHIPELDLKDPMAWADHITANATTIVDAICQK